MGRKSVDRVRKINPKKRREWIKQLYPHFRDQGLQDLKMDRIAKLLNKSKSTVYEYFATKEEIVAETISFKLEALLGFEDILENKEHSLEKRYQLLMEYMIPVLTDISNILLADIKQLFPQLWVQIDSFYDHASMVLKRYYQEGMDKGVFRKINPAILSLSDRFFFTELVDPQFLKDNQLKPEDAFKAYFELKFKGLEIQS